MKRPYAVFDIDGTLIRWQLFHAIVDELGKQGVFPGRAYQEILAARQQWKQRSGSTSFKNYEHRLILFYNSIINGLSVNVFNQAVKVVFSEHKDQVYSFSRDLIGQLKAKNYLLFAISGSQQEVVELLAKYYGFDDWAGTVSKQSHGVFTGERDVLSDISKVEALKKLIKKHQARQAGSLAIGDSESDIKMLEFVETAIVFNPTKLLLERAIKNNWLVVVERKNVIYKLEPNNGSYLLAAPNSR